MTTSSCTVCYDEAERQHGCQLFSQDAFLGPLVAVPYIQYWIGRTLSVEGFCAE